MNNKLINSLIALKKVLGNPAIDKIADEDLKNQLQLSGRVLARLLVEQTIEPKLRSEALQSFGNAAAEIEKLFAKLSISVDTVSRLKTLCLAMNPDDFKHALLLARDVQQHLMAIDNDEARTLRRELVRIEADCSRQFSDAHIAQIMSAALDDTNIATAINTKTLDEDKLNKFLSAAFPEEKDIRLAEYSFLSAGFSKYTAKIKLAGVHNLPSSVILRGDGAGTYGGVSVKDEYRLLKVLHEHGVCVARPLALEETGSVFGAPIMLTEEVSGEITGDVCTMWKPNAPACLDAAVKLAKLHQVPIAELGDKVDGADMSNRDKATIWINESYDAWKALNLASPLYETAFNWLRKNIKLYDGVRGLVHGDYNMHNLLVTGNHVGAILDWEFAHIGNPLYDIGYFYFTAESLGIIDEFLQAYKDAGGFAPTKEQLDYCILFAATRLGVMTCQTEAAFESGKIKAIRSAVLTNKNIMIKRVGSVLTRVL